MSAPAATDQAEVDDGGSHICQAPSCWEPGTVVEVADRAVENAPVLCETHRKQHLGVST